MEKILVDQLASEFRIRLVETSNTVEAVYRPFVVVVGGAPGSGKTAVANSLAFMTNSYHVQANSARQLLRSHGLGYGENVHLIIEAILRRLLSRKRPVILDGMLTEEKERELIRKIASEYGAKTFFIAIMCDPAIAQERAKKRSNISSFTNWRPDPEEMGEYLESIRTRYELLKKNIEDISDSFEDGILRFNNNNSDNDVFLSEIRGIVEEYRKYLSIDLSTRTRPW